MAPAGNGNRRLRFIYWQRDFSIARTSRQAPEGHRLVEDQEPSGAERREEDLKIPTYYEEKSIQRQLQPIATDCWYVTMFRK